jgi:GTP cyclohydrolase II
MGILQRLFAKFNKKERLKSSPSIQIFTKYGPCRAKMLRHRENEYLLLWSDLLDGEQVKWGYIYANKHTQHSSNAIGCDCNDQVDIALKMMMQEQGFIIYSSSDVLDIEKCLHKISARGLVTTKEREAPLEQSMDSFTSEYAVVTYIMQTLDIKKVHLVSSDPGIALHIQRYGVELVEWASVISFDYGDDTL